MPIEHRGTDTKIPSLLFCRQQQRYFLIVSSNLLNSYTNFHPLPVFEDVIPEVMLDFCLSVQNKVIK